eukprot:13062358-Alexandrium_andersonii.AAC.1
MSGPRVQFRPFCLGGAGGGANKRFARPPFPAKASWGRRRPHGTTGQVVQSRSRGEGTLQPERPPHLRAYP